MVFIFRGRSTIVTAMHRPPTFRSQNGFTVVELLVVIGLIGIIATLVIAVYTGTQEKARLAKMRADLASIQEGLALYRTDNGQFPVSASEPGCADDWCGWDQATGDAFVPGLVPNYMRSIPQLDPNNAYDDTYLYRSVDGKEYQLIRLNRNGLSTAERGLDTMFFVAESSFSGQAWGVKSSN